MFYLYSVYFLLLFKCTKCTFYFYGVFTKTRMNSASNTEIVCCSTRTEAAYHRLVLLERSCELCRFSATLEPLCFVQHWKLVSQTLVLPWPQFHVWDLFFFFYLFFYSLRSNACSCFLPHQKECVHCITFTAFRACQGPWDHAACNCCELHVFMWWPFENNPPMSSVRAVLIGEFFFLSGLKSSYFYQGIDGALSSSV